MAKIGRRENRTGSVTLLKSGKYRARITVGKKPNGKPDNRYHTTRTKPEAKKWLDARLAELREGRVVVDHDQTVSQFLAEWLEQVVKPDKAAGTYVGYEVNVRLHINPYIGHLPLADLQPEHIQRMMTEERKLGQSPHTTSYVLRTLKVALRHAVRWKRIARNPADLITPPRARPREATIFTQEQAQRFLAAVKGDRLEAFYTVALALALRKGEALGLKWADVSLERRTIAVRASLQRHGGHVGLYPTKNKTSTRVILLPRMVIASLKEHRIRQLEERMHAAVWHDEDYVFTTTRGTPIEPRDINRHFAKVLKRAGLEHIRVHDLRHSGASLMLAQGVPLHVVSKVLGHSSIRITADVYAHVYSQEFQDATSAMDDALGGG